MRYEGWGVEWGVDDDGREVGGIGVSRCEVSELLPPQVSRSFGSCMLLVR